jgi:hypothetical protein
VGGVPNNLFYLKQYARATSTVRPCGIGRIHFRGGTNLGPKPCVREARAPLARPRGTTLALLAAQAARQLNRRDGSIREVPPAWLDGDSGASSVPCVRSPSKAPLVIGPTWQSTFDSDPSQAGRAASRQRWWRAAASPTAPAATVHRALPLPRTHCGVRVRIERSRPDHPTGQSFS